jgi:hypothetical protein
MRKVIITIGFMVLAINSFAIAAENKYFYSSGQILQGESWNNVYVQNDNTIVDMLGGQVDSLIAFNRSTFNMVGGEILHYNIGPTNEISMGRWSTLNVYNGTIAIADFILSGDSYTLISGGDITVGRLKVYYNAIVDIRGGRLQFNSFDMVGYDLLPTINVYGYGFNYNPTGGTDGDGLLTGYLLDSSFFSIDQLSASEFQRFSLIPEFN